MRELLTKIQRLLEVQLGQLDPSSLPALHRLIRSSPVCSDMLRDDYLAGASWDRFLKEATYPSSSSSSLSGSWCSVALAGDRILNNDGDDGESVMNLHGWSSAVDLLTGRFHCQRTALPSLPFPHDTYAV